MSPNLSWFPQSKRARISISQTYIQVNYVYFMRISYIIDTYLVFNLTAFTSGGICWKLHLKWRKHITSQSPDFKIWFLCLQISFCFHLAIICSLQNKLQNIYIYHLVNYYTNPPVVTNKQFREYATGQNCHKWGIVKTYCEFRHEVLCTPTQSFQN